MPQERDYQKEWQREKITRKTSETRIVVKVLPSVADDFVKQCERRGTTRNAVLKEYIEKYTYGESSHES